MLRLRESDYGVVTGGDRTAFNDERIVAREFALNLEAWIVRAVRRQEIRDEEGAIISRSEIFYDDETFSGGNLGSVTRGNVTLVRQWIDAGAENN